MPTRIGERCNRIGFAVQRDQCPRTINLDIGAFGVAETAGFQCVVERYQRLVGQVGGNRCIASLSPETRRAFVDVGIGPLCCVDKQRRCLGKAEVVSERQRVAGGCQIIAFFLYPFARLHYRRCRVGSSEGNALLELEFV